MVQAPLTSPRPQGAANINGPMTNICRGMTRPTYVGVYVEYMYTQMIITGSIPPWPGGGDFRPLHEHIRGPGPITRRGYTGHNALIPGEAATKPDVGRADLESDSRTVQTDGTWRQEGRDGPGWSAIQA